MTPGSRGGRPGRSGRSSPGPAYARALRLRHVDLPDLVCFGLFEGMIAIGALLALAELVTWWAVLVLPAVVAVMVKINDLIAGALATGARGTAAMPATTPALTQASGEPFGVRRIGRDRSGTLYRVDPPWRRVQETAQHRVHRWWAAVQARGGRQVAGRR